MNPRSISYLSFLYFQVFLFKNFEFRLVCKLTRKKFLYIVVTYTTLFLNIRYSYPLYHILCDNCLNGILLIIPFCLKLGGTMQHTFCSKPPPTFIRIIHEICKCVNEANFLNFWIKLFWYTI